MAHTGQGFFGGRAGPKARRCLLSFTELNLRPVQRRPLDHTSTGSGAAPREPSQGLHLPEIIRLAGLPAATPRAYAGPPGAWPVLKIINTEHSMNDVADNELER